MSSCHPSLISQGLTSVCYHRQENFYSVNRINFPLTVKRWNKTVSMKQKVKGRLLDHCALRSCCGSWCWKMQLPLSCRNRWCCSQNEVRFITITLSVLSFIVTVSFLRVCAQLVCSTRLSSASGSMSWKWRHSPLICTSSSVTSASEQVCQFLINPQDGVVSKDKMIQSK